MQETNYSNLTDIQKQLVDEATKAMETAYNPYSGFFVGSAVLTQNGEIVTGSNVENSAYGSSICAERSALLSANAKGFRKIKMLALNSRGSDFDTTEISAPCGACRQMIYESSQVSNTNIEIILSTTKKDKIVITTINELFPLAFGPKDIGINLEKFQT